MWYASKYLRTIAASKCHLQGPGIQIWLEEMLARLNDFKAQEAPISSSPFFWIYRQNKGSWSSAAMKYPAWRTGARMHCCTHGVRDAGRDSVHLFTFIWQSRGKSSLWGKKKQREWLNFIFFGDHMGPSGHWPIQPDFDPYLPIRLSY